MTNSSSKNKNLMSAEAVGRGHPDKVCDQISDAILDYCLLIDPSARVAVETLIKGGEGWCKVIVAGEITVYDMDRIKEESIDSTIRGVLREIGYDDWAKGCNADEIEVINLLTTQSPDIAQGVDHGGAGDQGIMFGYATNETLKLNDATNAVRTSLAPIPHIMAHRILIALENLEPDHPMVGRIGPDFKCQVTAEYDSDRNFIGVDKVILAIQHREDVDRSTYIKHAKSVVHDVIFEQFGIHARPDIVINGTGKFVIGGPHGDAGVTGRKIIVDTSGGISRHGGGAFSGKDPSKVDRSAAYASRWAAKHVVAAGLAARCEIQLAYVIGVSKPLSIHVDTFNTGVIPDTAIEARVKALFDFQPNAIIESLGLRECLYAHTAWGGHFGRDPEAFPWERLDADILRDLACTLTTTVVG